MQISHVVGLLMAKPCIFVQQKGWKFFGNKKLVDKCLFLQSIFVPKTSVHLQLSKQAHAMTCLKLKDFFDRFVVSYESCKKIKMASIRNVLCQHLPFRCSIDNVARIDSWRPKMKITSEIKSLRGALCIFFARLHAGIFSSVICWSTFSSFVHRLFARTKHYFNIQMVLNPESFLIVARYI